MAGLASPLVDVTGARVSSDEYSAEMFADLVQGTLCHGGVSVHNSFQR